MGKEEEKEVIEPPYKWVKFVKFVGTKPGTNQGYAAGHTELFPTAVANRYIAA